MSNHEWESMNERDFETMLEKSVLDFPPDDVVEDVTPWRKAMSRVLIGMALCAITLNFWCLNYILPAVGMVLSLLGFRSLWRENKWFRNCFIITVILFPDADSKYDHYPKHNFYSPSHIGANRCKPFASACRVLLSLAWTQSCAEKSKSSSASGRCRCTDYLVCTHVRSGCYSV